MYQGIVLLASVVFSVAVLMLFHYDKRDHAFSVFLRGLVLFFCAVGFFRFMLSDSFVFVINGGYYDEVFYEATDPLQTVLRWGFYLNYAVLPMAVFYESRLFRNIASLVCLPFSVLSAVFFEDFMPYFLSEAGRGLHFTPAFRYFYFALELVLAISIPLILCIKKKHIFCVKSRGEWCRFLIATPLIALLMIPVYAPQSLFGYSSMIAGNGSSYHTGWLVLLCLATVGLYHAFRFRPREERRMLLVFLTVVLFFHYDSLYLMGFSIPRLPIQLCNLAAYFFIFAIIFNMPRFFQFCFIVNSTGTLIALLLPDFMPGAFGFWNMHFVLEHSLVFIIPILGVALRLYERPRPISLKYSVIGFSIYFVFCLTAGILLNGYAAETGFRVNYFFLFDLDKAYGFLPILQFTRAFTVHFGRFEINPVFVGIVYVAFQLACVGFYYLSGLFGRYADDHFALRNAAINLYERRKGKTLNIPRELPRD